MKGPVSRSDTSRHVRQRQADRSDKTISTLRAVALDLLVEGGVTSLNLSELGDRAGYSRGIVHYHFGSKEALLIDLLQNLMKGSSESFASVDEPGLKGISRLIRSLEDFVRKYPNKALAQTMLLNEAAASRLDALNELVAKYNRNAREKFESQIRGEAGLADRGDAGDIAALILAALRGIHQQWLAEREDFDVLGKLSALRSFIETAFVAHDASGNALR